MKHLDLFSGIGGFALAARRVGWETIGFCEPDRYCQAVLAKHWPKVPIHPNVRNYRGIRDGADVVTGGFPCQDLSSAGKRIGIDGARSGLWSELARILGEVRPRFAVVENVPNLLGGDYGRWFGRVLGDLAALGFDVEWHCISASYVGAPHERDRVWIVAYPHEHRLEANANYPLLRIQAKNAREPRYVGSMAIPCGGHWIGAAPCGTVDVGMAHGVPNRMDRLAALGNAIVPQVAEEIFRAIAAVSKPS